MSSDSDSSGPSKTPPPKKAKKRSASAVDSAGGKKTNPDGDQMFELGQKKFVTPREWKGRKMVDIREYYEKDGKTLPGKKGISLSKEQWETLKGHMKEIDEIIDSM